MKKNLVTMQDVIYELGYLCGDSFEDTYKLLHTEDKGKYRVGETVKYIGTSFPDFTGQEFTVVASNVQDENSTEYLLEHFPFLVWEEELEKIL